MTRSGLVQLFALGEREAMDPEAALGLAGANTEVADVAREAKARRQRVVRAV